MQSVFLVFGLWFLFGASHIGLATRAVREPLVARLGERGFIWSFSLLASVLFAALVVAYSEVRFLGPRGVGLAIVPWARTPLLAAIVVGLILMVGAFAPSGYWSSASAPLLDEVRPARGLERISRHPFFSGLVLFAGAHALLVPRLTGTIFFAGFVMLAVFGSFHQARKLSAKKGEPFARYLDSTSAVPFVAVIRRRQRLNFSEIPWIALGIGAVVAFGLRKVHDRIFVLRGALVIGTVVGLSLVIILISVWRASRTPAPETGAPKEGIS